MLQKKKKYTCITPQQWRTIWGVTSGEITSSQKKQQTDRWPCKDSHFLFFNKPTSFSEACGCGRPDIINGTPHSTPPPSFWNPLWISHNQTSICPPYAAEADKEPICLIDLWRLLPCGRARNIVIP